MKTKEFSKGLIVKSTKSAVVFETNIEGYPGHSFGFKFSKDEFEQFHTYMKEAAHSIWNNLIPKDATSEASDYWEYYDRKLDNNGYLRIGDDELLIDRPSRESNRLYKFNKRKMETFLYDLAKKN